MYKVRAQEKANKDAKDTGGHDQPVSYGNNGYRGPETSSPPPGTSNVHSGNVSWKKSDDTSPDESHITWATQAHDTGSGNDVTPSAPPQERQLSVYMIELHECVVILD